MSQQWAFYTFSEPRFQRTLGGGEVGVDELVVNAAMWDEAAWRNPDSVRGLAKRIALQGIGYAGLNTREAADLDVLLQVLFSPEGFADQWEVTPESPDGLHPSVVEELLTKSSGSQLLSLLISGRRYQAIAPFDCGYCFLSPDESLQIISEVERALATGGPWSGDWLLDVVNESLIGPLKVGAETSRHIFGALS